MGGARENTQDRLSVQRDRFNILNTGSRTKHSRTQQPRAPLVVEPDQPDEVKLTELCVSGNDFGAAACSNSSSPPADDVRRFQELNVSVK